MHCNAQTLYTLPYLISHITFPSVITFLKLPHIVFFIHFSFFKNYGMQYFFVKCFVWQSVVCI